MQELVHTYYTIGNEQTDRVTTFAAAEWLNIRVWQYEAKMCVISSR